MGMLFRGKTIITVIETKYLGRVNLMGGGKGAIGKDWGATLRLHRGPPGLSSGL